MATQSVEVRLQVAAARREQTQPFRYKPPQRAAASLALASAPPVAAPPPLIERALAKARSLPRPSWLTVLLAVAAAAATMWWIMSRQLPDIDPARVIATNLAAARQAASQERFVEPMERSALYYYRTVLALDPANIEARNGVERIAAHFVERAKASLVDNHIAEAVVALDGLRRTEPTHRRLPLLDVQLRKAIEERALLRTPQAAPPASPAAERSPAPKLARAETAPPQPLATKTAGPERATRGDGQPETGDGRRATNSSGSAAPPEPPVDAMTEPVIDRVVVASPGAAPEIAPAPTPPPERKLVNYVAPEYPREALMRGIEGWIDLKLFITPEGEVVDPRIEDGKARQLFDRAALVAVRRWKYEARPGESAPQPLQVRVTFELKD